MGYMINTLSDKISNLKIVLNSSSLKLDHSHSQHMVTKGVKLNGGKHFPVLNSPLRMRVKVAEIKRGQIFACIQYPAERFSYKL